MIYVLGGRGRLGRAMADAWGPNNVALLQRSVYEDWWRPGAHVEVRRYFDTAAPGSVVVIAAGLLDPALPEAEHERVNVALAVQVIDGACSAGLRVVTLGTVMERLAYGVNRYVAAKARLAEAVVQRASEGLPVLHAQLHTLYGFGPPSPHMFLGQMFKALEKRQLFEMSPGQQLREYHHVDDDVAAIRALLATQMKGVVALSHGEPCALRDLAVDVFEQMHCMHLLRLGARPEPPIDNFATVLTRPSFLSDVDFRPALPNVARYMQDLLAHAATSNG